MEIKAIADEDLLRWMASREFVDDVKATVERYRVQRKGGVRVTMADVRAAKMCAKGARAFFNRHGLDWSDFLHNGIDAEILAEINDAMSNKVIEVARGRQQ